jgi:hypothetical protein
VNDQRNVDVSRDFDPLIFHDLKQTFCCASSRVTKKVRNVLLFVFEWMHDSCHAAVQLGESNVTRSMPTKLTKIESFSEQEYSFIL